MTPLDDTGESSSCSVTARQKPTVDFTQDGTLGILTLDNPPLNLIGAELISDLRDAIGELETSNQEPDRPPSPAGETPSTSPLPNPGEGATPRPTRMRTCTADPHRR